MASLDGVSVIPGRNTAFGGLLERRTNSSMAASEGYTAPGRSESNLAARELMAILTQPPELVVAQSHRQQRTPYSKDFRPVPFSRNSWIGMPLGTAAGVFLVLLCGSGGSRAITHSRGVSCSAERGAQAAISPSNAAFSATLPVLQVAQPALKASQLAVQTVPLLPALDAKPGDASDPAATTSTTNASESNRPAEEKSGASAPSTLDESKQHQEIKPTPAEKPHTRPAHPVRRIPRFALASLFDSKASEILRVI